MAKKATGVAPGLRWYKLDLHVHTPASQDFDRREITAAEFVAAALAQGLDGVAVTDHNTGSWVDRVLDAAKGKLAVFPGVEITATGGEGGIHIIALFGTDAGTKTIENLLGALDIRADKYGKPEAFTPRSPQEVIGTIGTHGGIAVLAHADSTNGLLAEMRGQPRIATVRDVNLGAIEIVKDVPKYKKLFDGSDPDYQRRLCIYRASDNPSPTTRGVHSADGIGSRFSWFKMDDVSLEALHQCLCDPEVRVRTDAESAARPQQDCPRLVSFSVSQGFLAGQPFEFNAGLNSIIGGKGVGKSLIVEFLRFALGQPSHIQAIQDDMKEKLRNQLGVGGVVTVVVELPTGERVTAERTFNEGADPVTLTAGDGRSLQAGIPELFPILAYSQTEAVEIAKDESAQLKLIDAFVDIGAQVRQMDSVRQKLAKLDRQLAESLRAASVVGEERKRLSTLGEQIRQIGKTLESQRFTDIEKLEPKTNYLKTLGETAQDLQTLLVQTLEQVGDLEAPEQPENVSSDPTAQALYGQLKSQILESRRSIGALEAKARSVEKAIEKSSKEWQKRVDKATDEYRKWLGEVGGDKPKLMARRKKLQEEEAQVRNIVQKQEELAAVASEVRAKRNMLLDQLDALATEVYEARRAEYASISSQSGGRVGLELVKSGNRTRLRDGLVALKRGSYLREREIAEIADKVTPRRLVDCVIEGDAKRLSKEAQIDAATAKRLIDILGTAEDFSEVLALQHEGYPEDLPLLQFLKDDGQYYDIKKLSVGQKCSVLLVIALAEGAMPVIIDQPEDALDIPSVYQDITLQIRGRKDRRQFILTTHNATVAVGGDSDKFIVLKGTATSGAVETSGAIEREDVRGQVIQHLEGGTESLDLKRRKYRQGSQ